MTPTDQDAFVGMPPLWVGIYDEVHVSVTFTWDIRKAEILADEWQKQTKAKVQLGGPALAGRSGDFNPGMYLREGVTITSRGCPNHCWFCLVPHREGNIRELPICPGHIIQDDNLLACSSQHIDAVFTMLRTQHRIEFAGGLESLRLTPEIAERLAGLRIKHIWLSYDEPDDEQPLRYAVANLQPFFSRRQIRCYVLIGYPGDTLTLAERRLEKAWDMGTLPFAMRYRKAVRNFVDSFVYTERQWNLLTRKWSRPAAIKASHKALAGPAWQSFRCT